MTGPRHDVSRTRDWMREGTRFFLDHLGELADDEFARPSLLSGWTRGHVIGHLARNAEALVRLVNWARTGVETPMYADRAQRAEEIEDSARLPAVELRRAATQTAGALEAALDGLTGGQWASQVRSALGRAIPAAEIPWMRVREVWLHTIDIGNGAALEELPPGVVDVLLDDVTATLSTKDGCPARTLAPPDRGRTWLLGVPGGERPVLTAPAALTVGWLTGRVPAAALPGGVPELPRWL